ncbi:hypothetical protein O9929_16130 [Vibrio lentus]|nr:hypothetical protein [Vibrio lentus]
MAFQYQDAQTVIRSNRDVVYSTMVVDVSEGTTFHVRRTRTMILPDCYIMDENHLVRQWIAALKLLNLTAADDLTTGTHVHVLARTRIAESIEDTCKRRQDTTFYQSKILTSLIKAKATTQVTLKTID